MRVEGFQADREAARTKRTYARQVRRGRIAKRVLRRPPAPGGGTIRPHRTARAAPAGCPGSYARGLACGSRRVIVTLTPGSAIAWPR